jgi:predicted metal-binding protein
MANNEEMQYILKHEFAKIPIYQYAFLDPEDIPYDENLRIFCNRRCENFKTNWSCPPAVSPLNKCHERMLTYDGAVMFSSIAREEKEQKKLAKAPRQTPHELLTNRIDHYIEGYHKQTYILTSGKCEVCKKCTYPKERCRYPELLHPCIESHGIDIVKLSEQSGMDYYLDERNRIKFSIIFYRNITEAIRK